VCNGSTPTDAIRNEPSSARRCGSSAVTFGNPVYQLAEAAMKLSIKDLFDAAIRHIFIARQRIKLVFQ